MVEKILKISDSISSPISAVSQLIEAYRDYQNIIECERNKRQEIDDWEKAEIARIQDIKTKLIDRLEKKFDDRAKTLSNLFKQVDRAIKNRDDELLTKALNEIVNIVCSSPF